MLKKVATSDVRSLFPVVVDLQTQVFQLRAELARLDSKDPA